jgi:hypothetical protein
MINISNPSENGSAIVLNGAIPAAGTAFSNDKASVPWMNVWAEVFQGTLQLGDISVNPPTVQPFNSQTQSPQVSNNWSFPLANPVPGAVVGACTLAVWAQYSAGGPVDRAVRHFTGANPPHIAAATPEQDSDSQEP